MNAHQQVVLCELSGEEQVAAAGPGKEEEEEEEEEKDNKSNSMPHAQDKGERETESGERGEKKGMTAHSAPSSAPVVPMSSLVEKEGTHAVLLGRRPVQYDVADTGSHWDEVAHRVCLSKNNVYFTLAAQVRPAAKSKLHCDTQRRRAERGARRNGEKGRAGAQGGGKEEGYPRGGVDYASRRSADVTRGVTDVVHAKGRREPVPPLSFINPGPVLAVKYALDDKFIAFQRDARTVELGTLTVVALGKSFFD